MTKKKETTDEVVEETTEEMAQPVEETPQEPVAPVVEATGGPVSVGGKAERMRDALAQEPKVRILVPLSSGEKPGVTQSVILNGYSLYIRKGEYVEVPQSVAEVLEVKMKHKLAVENHPLRADGTGEVKMDIY
jgi:hypothetical protein